MYYGNLVRTFENIEEKRKSKVFLKIDFGQK